MKGKKPTVHQRNALKRKVKDDWVNYLYLKEEVVNVGDEEHNLQRDSMKETRYVFIHKDTKEILKVVKKK